MINRAGALSLVKWLVLAGVCLVAAADMTSFEGNPHIDRENFVRPLLIIVTLAGVYYKLSQPAVTEVEQRTG